MGFAASARVLAAELEVAIQEVSNQWRLIIICRIPSCLRRAFDTYTIPPHKVEIPGASQIRAMLVPDNDVTGLEAGADQPFNHRGDQRRARARMGAGSRINLQPDDIFRPHELPPGIS